MANASTRFTDIKLIKATWRNAVFHARISGEPFILKQFYPPEKPDIVERLKTGLEVASLHMKDPHFQVNKCLEVFSAQGIAVLSYAPGVTVAEQLVISSAKERITLLERCGEWHLNYIGNRHKPSPFPKTFWESNLEQIKPPAMRSDKKYIFDVLRANLHTRIAGISGKTQITAATHGDFSVENIIVDTETLTGIDIEGTKWMPVSRESARFLVYLHSSYPQPAQTMEHGLFLEDKNALFTSGLMQGGEAPEIFRFFTGYHLLLRYMNMRADPDIYERILTMIGSYLEGNGV